MSKEAIKRFLIETSVENAEGSQTWYVDATSEAEALKQYEQGGCDLYASNVDVTSLGGPEISGETTLDDFGDFAEQPAPATELREQEPPTVAELVCVCGAEWEWRNRDWELVTTPPAQPQHEPVSDRENAIIRFALHQFMSNAYSNMNAAAQDKDSRHYTVGAVEKFAKDAKDAKALLSRLQFKATQPAQQQEPVAFLANGTRFKISYDSRQSGGQIHGIPPELGGRWVAFVAAEDDCHLKPAPPQPAQPSKPLTDEQAMALTRGALNRLDVVRKTEAAHGIKENT